MNKTGDEFGIGRVTFVPPEFLHAEGLDALGIDHVDAGRPDLVESLCNGIAVMSRLFQASNEALGSSGLGQPFDQ